MKSAHPPALPRFLLEHMLAPGSERETMIGDLEEEFSTFILPELGPRNARRWYWRQITRSVAPVLVQRLRQSSTCRCATGVALAGLAVVLTFALLAGSVVALFNFVAVPDYARLLTYVTVGFIAAAAGGYVAGIVPSVRGRRGWLGLAALVLLLLIAIFAGTPERQPVAAWIIWALLLCFGLVTGRGLASRAVRRPATTAP